MRFFVGFIIMALAFAVGWLLYERLPETEHVTPDSEIDRAWEAIHVDRSDPVRWSRLGDAEAAAGAYLEAEHAYRTAIRLGGADGLAHARLGFLYYSNQEDQKALAMLKEARRRGADVPMLDYTIAQILEGEGGEGASALHPKSTSLIPPQTIRPGPTASQQTLPDAGVVDAAAPEVDPPAPPPSPPVVARHRPEPEPEPAPVYDECSTAAIPIHGGRSFLIAINIEGSEARLIIDTGASLTVLTEAFADEAGIRSEPGRQLSAITANGRVKFDTAVVREVELEGRLMPALRVAICPECVESVADGLLGLDVVAAMGLQLDLAAKTVRFRDCEQ